MILLLIVIILLIAALPSWPYSRGWGYYPSGGLGLILLILLLRFSSGGCRPLPVTFPSVLIRGV